MFRNSICSHNFQCAFILLLTADDATMRPSARSILTGDDGLFDQEWEGIASSSAKSIDDISVLKQRIASQSSRITYLEKMLEQQNLLLEEKEKEITRLKSLP